MLAGLLLCERLDLVPPHPLSPRALTISAPSSWAHLTPTAAWCPGALTSRPRIEVTPENIIVSGSLLWFFIRRAWTFFTCFLSSVTTLRTFLKFLFYILALSDSLILFCLAQAVFHKIARAHLKCLPTFPLEHSAALADGCICQMGYNPQPQLGPLQGRALCVSGGGRGDLEDTPSQVALWAHPPTLSRPAPQGSSLNDSVPLPTHCFVGD